MDELPDEVGLRDNRFGLIGILLMAGVAILLANIN